MAKVFLYFALFSLLFSPKVLFTEESGQMEKRDVQEEALFAMGCFWCGATAFNDEETKEKLPGILSVRVGYAGGAIDKPTYEHHPGYKEAVQVLFDPAQISYEKILDIFWHNIDPFDEKGQFCDKGFAYTSAIFYKNESQHRLAEETKEKMREHFNKPIATELIEGTTFYEAEAYHQEYYLKNPIRYKYYRWRCGRDARLHELWKKGAS